jgi:hypothetical protein
VRRSACHLRNGSGPEADACFLLAPFRSGVSIFGSDRLIKEGDTVKRTGEIVGASSAVLSPA